MHPQFGAVLLQRDVNMDLNVTMAVLQHHERQDGTGYPQRIKGTKEEPRRKRRERGGIHRFAEIIAVANHFDNLIGGFTEDGIKTPPEAVADIVEKTPSWFNPHVTQLALEVINVYPVGSNVRVRNSRHAKLIGYRGVVAKVHPDDLQRPSVVLLYSPKQRLHQPIEVDFRDDRHAELEFLIDL
jgi:HD-GYP domain-containing protein (c-di-GMP phosphodiesterase class II)